MIHRLLVPLDGSKLAETVLPAVAYLASELGASVRLIHCIERNAKPQVHHNQHLTEEQGATEYLEGIKKRLQVPGANMSVHVHADSIDNVARSIASHAETELPSDLIVMCMHGNEWAKRFLFGSIAQQAVAAGRTPVLLVNPNPRPEHDFRIRKVLLPLDPNGGHESGLDFILDYAAACRAEVQLLSVVPTVSTMPGKWTQVGRLLPGASSKLLDLAVEQAFDYLRERQVQAHSMAMTVGIGVCRGDPVKSILATAMETHADLIALASHGTAGFEAFWEASVPAGVIEQSPVPVLLVPVK